MMTTATTSKSAANGSLASPATPTPTNPKAPSAAGSSSPRNPLISLASSTLTTIDSVSRSTLGLPLLGLTADGRPSDPLAPIESALAAGPGSLLEAGQEWAIDHGMYTDGVLRRGVRALLHKRLADLKVEYAYDNVEVYTQRKHAFAQALREVEKVAILTDKANEQHYEVDTEFFRQCLGKNMKYSCCLYPRGDESLDEAEDAMLELYTERAELVDGLSILDMGCGWGSLSLFLAQKYPRSKITGVSNSKTQKAYIDAEAKRRGITNLKIVTADINQWSTNEKFDRVMSVEMFEHLKNYSTIFSLIHSLLRPGGKCFIHIFVHRSMPYHFQTTESQSWMARYFFSGGTMPSFDLFPSYFQDQLKVEHSWAVNGVHYAKTSRQWLENMDKRQKECMPWLVRCYGAEGAAAWWHRWRVFYIAVEELFAFNSGNEWFVGHYLLSKKE
ncbi:S-adenosyl-L-methionine-dependent methyltransferase [Catenaria anguillulae PL171]|uniref:S-adenosyl-L-methionine-dependent methyltransferase n=1 Tax=Catenaria anguillulae PL171 TaxID=765915 RepID=A0A1Y2HUU1_9FUNG|nr:S-adenosyl-L-methionine-dependent methyltransferase [Catenaria anguillulae PL171]